jgi:hypothetical protein
MYLFACLLRYSLPESYEIRRPKRGMDGLERRGMFPMTCLASIECYNQVQVEQAVAEVWSISTCHHACVQRISNVVCPRMQA